MGSWGTESCSNDSCWDCLDAINIHKMTQIDANHSITKLWEEADYEEFYVVEDKLGVVIWILCQGLKVEAEKLVECLDYAKRFKRPDVMENQGWTNLEGRKESLEKEIEMIEAAIQNDGIGEKKHIKGLLDKMSDLIENK